MNRNKEVAKFLCGFEAYHALLHAFLWYSGTTLSAFGVKEGPKWHRAAAIGNAVASLALGWYAWGQADSDPADSRTGGKTPPAAHA